MESTFKIPEGIEFTENEKKGLTSLADHLNKQFSEFAKDKVSKEDMIVAMKEKVAEYAKENGFDKEKTEKMFKSLEEQGEALTKLKQEIKSGNGLNAIGLKAEFDKNYDALVKAVKEQKQGFSIKADPDTIDQNLIHDRTVISTTTGANLIEQEGRSTELYMKRRPYQYIADIADISIVANVPETFTFEEEGDEEGYIAIVDENGLKPQLQLKLIKNKVEAKKAAGFIVVTEELMKWRTRAWAAIQRLFRDKVMRDFHNKLTDTLLLNATSYIGTSLDGTILDANEVDAIVAVVAQLESLDFYPDVLVMNPVDKWKISLLKENGGAYLLPIVMQDGMIRIAQLRVITSNKVEVGKFLVGESGIWKVEREEPQLRTGLVNDDLIHNRMTIVGEIFFLSYVPSNNAGGFVLANFDDVKESLLV